MPTETILQPIEDAIIFSLSAEETIVNRTVKITANIACMVVNITEEVLRDSIRDMLKKFIDGTWHISNTTRSIDASGMERINLNATTRVEDKEYYNLDQRAKDASNKGMAISSIQVDTTPSAAMIEEAESKLRIEVLRKAVKECGAINKALTTSYRVGTVDFEETDTNNFSNSRKIVAMASSYVSSPSPSGGSETLGNSMKLTKTARIELRHRNI